MSDVNQPTPPTQSTSHAAPTAGSVPVPSAPPGPMHLAATGEIGKVRDTGMCILLTVVTLGFYSLYWYFKTHEEMKRHSGAGVGGGIALILALFVGVVMPFVSSNEVGGLYQRRGQQPPVTAATGLWVLLLGWFFFVGAIVWFVKTNGALNDYWKSLGAS